MSRRTIRAFGVLDAYHRLHTTRETQAAAEDAAKILGGTEWAADGWTVKPVTVTIAGIDVQAGATTTRHPDMIE